MELHPSGLCITRGSALLGIGFFVILTVPSLLILDFPKIAMVPLLFFIPTIIFARFWLGAMWKQPLGLNISWGRLALFVANFAILCLAAVYSYNHGLRPVREPVLNTFGFNILAAISALAFCLAASGEPRPVSALMSGLLLAALAICSLDLALHLGGYVNPGSAWQPQTKTPGLFFTLLGFKAHRVMMPLSSAFQNGAVVPTLLCVIAMGAGGRWVWLRGAAFGLGLLLLLLLDTRMFILAIAIAFLSRVLSRIPWALAATALALPWLEVAVVVYADLFPSVAEIAGGRSTAYGLFSGRQFIWEKCWDYLAWTKSGPLLLGNGLFGQANTGISRQYAAMFAYWPAEDRSAISVHNAFLQMLLDVGIVGLAAFGLMLFFAVSRAETLARRGGPDAPGWRIVSLVLLTFASIAGTEMVLGVYMKESIAITSCLFLATALFGGRRAPRRNQVTIIVRFRDWRTNSEKAGTLGQSTGRKRTGLPTAHLISGRR
ncbi:hypothetical protein GCM10011614_09200 [Novosphingobium colocasiae]|uniref:O-antigen ligase-related domain-containing protein n=1 Tax=Novosphingobium colocasiae TaxID=1256513 RepID=A0A918UEI7_9SPHN|nr:hypothetical protein GCM10011614_09200 [Novosphingobium colocasiae]